MTGMGTYTPFERELGSFTSDEMNELYLSGDLDKMYENYEQQKEGQSKFNYNYKTRQNKDNNNQEGKM